MKMHPRRLLIAWGALVAAAAQQPGKMPGAEQALQWPLVKYINCLDRTKIHSKEEYYTCEDKYLDGLIAKWEKPAKSGRKLIFSANAQVLHALGIGNQTEERLATFVKAMKESGAGRVDMNPSPLAWLKPIPDTIAKYDFAIKEIRKAGMQISFNPTTFPGFDPRVKYDGWRDEALKMYAELARRYKPDVFSVMHEPWSMDHRLGEHVTPQQWHGFIGETCGVVKKESPNTLCVSSYLPMEMDVLEQALTVPALDGIGLDIYQEYDDFQTFDKMIQMAKAAGKFAYIAETGRTMITFRNGVIDFDAVASVPDPLLAKLDPKWMKAMTYYAMSRGMPALVEFWTATFFAYLEGEENPQTRAFNQAVEKGMMSGARTPTFTAFQALAKQYGRKGKCPECAK
jgi:hypothetical protein